MRYLKMTTSLSFSPRSIEKLHDLFRTIDLDDSGSIDMNEFLIFFHLQKSRFAIRCFNVIDADGSGEIDFGEFVLGLWNFCTFDTASLCRFAFEMYDTDGSGFLDHDEIKFIVRELYGKRNFKRSVPAQKCMQQLKEWSGADGNGGNGESGGTGENAGGGGGGGNSDEGRVNFHMFEKFCKHHEILLLPAFLMQLNLQKRVLGTGFWDALSIERHQVERSLLSRSDRETKKSVENLLNKLREMAVESEEVVVLESEEVEKVLRNGGGDGDNHPSCRERVDTTCSRGEAEAFKASSSSSASNALRRSKYIMHSLGPGSPKSSGGCNAKSSPKMLKVKKKKEVKARIKAELRAERHALQHHGKKEKKISRGGEEACN